MGTMNHITSSADLRAWRGRLGWSQTRAAAELRVVDSSLGNLESGCRQASGTILRLAEVLEEIASMASPTSQKAIEPAEVITTTAPATTATQTADVVGEIAPVGQPATPIAAEPIGPISPAAPVMAVMRHPVRRSSLAPRPEIDEPEQGVAPPVPVDELAASVVLNAEELGYAVHGEAADMLVASVSRIRMERRAPYRAEELRQDTRRSDDALEPRWRALCGKGGSGLVELAFLIDIAAD